ncbi:hypothetical protein CMO96_00230 [Candidatus Woesebacteria bacterium]|nr:hypothetical protein [Candidatus Woesebacteria bacterium]
MNLLNKTKTYLVGHMQYADGRGWREDVEYELEKLNISVFNPFDKPFVKDVDEGEETRREVDRMMALGHYDGAAEKMKDIRIHDLNLVDRSDFIVAHLEPPIASWGSAEEIVTAVRMKKPVFVSMEGGKSKTPAWIMGMFPHKYIYNSTEEIVDIIKRIDNGEVEVDSDRWRLLREDLR